MTGLDDLLDSAGDDLVEGDELLGRAAQIVGGEHPYGDQWDVETVAPGEELEDLGGTDAVAMLGGLPASFAQRRLPSTITPRCCGSEKDSSSLVSRRS